MYAMFISVALLLFVLATVGFGVYAHVAIRGDTYDHALSEYLHYANEQLIGSALLLLPFLLLGLMAAAFFTRRSSIYGIVIFLIGAAILVALYYEGHMGAEAAMTQRHWTAAALSVGLLPFQGAGVLVILLVGGLIAGRAKGAKTET